MLETTLLMGAIGAAAGLIGGLLGLLLRGLNPAAPRHLGLVLAVVSVPISRAYLVPEYVVWRELGKADAAFDEHALFRALEEEHPEIRADFKRMLEEGLRSGEGVKVAKQRGFKGVSAARGQQLIVSLVQTLVAKHGPPMEQQLLAMQDPQQPGLDRRALCETTVTMYRAALAMPAPDNAQLLRTLLAPSPDAANEEPAAGDPAPAPDEPLAGLLGARDGDCPPGYVFQLEVCVHASLAASPDLAAQVDAYRHGAAPPLVEPK
jgi:hypothetical protein